MSGHSATSAGARGTIRGTPPLLDGSTLRGPSSLTTDLARMSLDDAAYCRQIVRRHARTFWLASRFLPPAKRRAAFALYAFCRVGDDIVDASTLDSPLDVITRLNTYRSQLGATIAGEPDGPLHRELAETLQRYAVPPNVLYELLDGVASDCAPSHYATWDQLSSYCEGVASTVGEMCTHVFGVEGGAPVHAHALRHARTLGIAMQLTNILRDVGEDGRNGRCYLPDDDLARFALSREEVLAGRLGTDRRWTALMRFEISRARDLYASAMPGIALLAADSRRCAAACAIGYAGILGAIEGIGYDTFRTRARLGAVARAGVLWQAWRTPPHPTHALAMDAPRVDDRPMATRA